MTRASVSTIFAATFVCSGITLQVMGRVIDRLGPFRTICLTIVPFLCGIGLTCTATGPAGITAGFIITRIFGPDGVEFSAKVVISRWFQRLRGRVMAMASITLAVEILLSGGFDRLADSIGWRSATAVAGSTSAALVFAGCLVLFDCPEVVGLLPDGDRPPDTPEGHAAAAAAEASSFTLAEATRTRALWAVAALAFNSSTGWGGLNVNMRSVCAEHGLPPATVAAIYSAIGVSSPVGALAMGWAVDRAGAAAGPAGQLRVFSIVSALSALSMLLAGGMGAAGPAGAGAAAALFGVSTGLFHGCFAVMLGSAAAGLFGRGPQLASIQVCRARGARRPASPRVCRAAALVTAPAAPTPIAGADVRRRGRCAERPPRTRRPGGGARDVAVMGRSCGQPAHAQHGAARASRRCPHGRAE